MLTICRQCCTISVKYQIEITALTSLYCGKSLSSQEVPDPKAQTILLKTIQPRYQLYISIVTLCHIILLNSKQKYSYLSVYPNFTCNCYLPTPGTSLNGGALPAGLFIKPYVKTPYIYIILIVSQSNQYKFILSVFVLYHEETSTCYSESQRSN